MQQGEVGAAIGRGLEFIRKEQERNGSFVSLASPVEKPFYCKTMHHTTFVPSLILNSLCGLEEAKDIRCNLAAWLINQKSSSWSFNYWSKNSPERHTSPYPDDLDDTFCALIGLYKNDPASVDAAALGSIVKLLIATETNVGGPYRTWLVPKDSPPAWVDVDLAVNSNIAYFLRLAAQPLPSLTRLIEDAITACEFRSPYYPQQLIPIYYAARAYRGVHQKNLTSYIKTLPLDNPQSMALAISAFHELGQDADANRLIKTLLQLQMPDGSWTAEAFCHEPQRQGRCYYYGAKTLTTALAIEALSECQKRPPAAPLRRADDTHKKDYEALLQQAKRELSWLGNDLRPRSLAMVDFIARGDTSREILLLPQLFYASLTKPAEHCGEFLARLSLASLYGWMAYTIYDNLMDGEGDINLLPVANTALCSSFAAFGQAMPGDKGFQTLVKQTFAAIDNANAWETTLCRFPVENQLITIGPLPDYNGINKLAGRSLGHTLAPMAILAKSGYPPNSRVANCIQNGLKYYIGARQLLDDMHDWEDDISNGRISYVTAAIARALGLGPGTYDLHALLPRFQRQFWHDTLLTTCRLAERHLADSRGYFLKSGVLNTRGPLNDLLARLDASLTKTRAEQSQANEFLKAYKKPLHKTGEAQTRIDTD